MHARTIAALGLVVTLGAALPTVACAQSQPQDKRAVTDEGEIPPDAAAKAFPKRGFSPYANRNYPTRVFWGDEHVHTGWSVDAGAFGCTLGPEEAAALRPRRAGHRRRSASRRSSSRPLDWVAITDHSDAAGVIFEIKNGNPRPAGGSARQEAGTT